MWYTYMVKFVDDPFVFCSFIWNKIIVYDLRIALSTFEDMWMLLSCSFAILSGPTIPIIGEGDEEANDR